MCMVAVDPTFAELSSVVSDEHSLPSQVPQAAACAAPGTSATSITMARTIYVSLFINLPFIYIVYFSALSNPEEENHACVPALYHSDYSLLKLPCAAVTGRGERSGDGSEVPKFFLSIPLYSLHLSAWTCN